MYTTFEIKIAFHIRTWEDRKTFIRAVREAMQLLYTQAAMISEEAPSIELSVEDGRHGIRKLKVFNEIEKSS